MSKKEALEQFHRNTISTVANSLFQDKGIEKTTMDDIARAAEYSKATLYVYFKSKEEICHYLTLKGMQGLHERLAEILQQDSGAIVMYMDVCKELAAFYEADSIGFQGSLEMIAADEKSRKQSAILDAVYQVGEQLNDDIEALLLKGVKEGVFRADLACIPTGLVHWASLSGIVLMAEKKQEYIGLRTGFSKSDFMQLGFQLTLQSIVKGGISVE